MKIFDHCYREKIYREKEKTSLHSPQVNVTENIHIRATIDTTQKNKKIRIIRERDETVSHLITECSKWANKQPSSDEEFCKRQKFSITHFIFIDPVTCTLKLDRKNSLECWDKRGPYNPEKKTNSSFDKGKKIFQMVGFDDILHER